MSSQELTSEIANYAAIAFSGLGIQMFLLAGIMAVAFRSRAKTGHQARLAMLWTSRMAMCLAMAVVPASQALRLSGLWAGSGPILVKVLPDPQRRLWCRISFAIETGLGEPLGLLIALFMLSNAAPRVRGVDKPPLFSIRGPNMAVLLPAILLTFPILTLQCLVLWVSPAIESEWREDETAVYYLLAVTGFQGACEPDPDHPTSCNYCRMPAAALVVPTVYLVTFGIVLWTRMKAVRSSAVSRSISTRAAVLSWAAPALILVLCASRVVYSVLPEFVGREVTSSILNAACLLLSLTLLSLFVFVLVIRPLWDSHKALRTLHEREAAAAKGVAPPASVQATLKYERKAARSATAAGKDTQGTKVGDGARAARGAPKSKRSAASGREQSDAGPLLVGYKSSLPHAESAGISNSDSDGRGATEERKASRSSGTGDAKMEEVNGAAESGEPESAWHAHGVRRGASLEVGQGRENSGASVADHKTAGPTMRSSAPMEGDEAGRTVAEVALELISDDAGVSDAQVKVAGDRSILARSSVDLKASRGEAAAQSAAEPGTQALSTSAAPAASRPQRAKPRTSTVSLRAHTISPPDSQRGKPAASVAADETSPRSPPVVPHLRGTLGSLRQSGGRAWAINRNPSVAKEEADAAASARAANPSAPVAGGDAKMSVGTYHPDGMVTPRREAAERPAAAAGAPANNQAMPTPRVPLDTPRGDLDRLASGVVGGEDVRVYNATLADSDGSRGSRDALDDTQSTQLRTATSLVSPELTSGAPPGLSASPPPPAGPSPALLYGDAANASPLSAGGASVSAGPRRQGSFVGPESSLPAPSMIDLILSMSPSMQQPHGPPPVPSSLLDTDEDRQEL
ncbi:unnamed protein product [Pedinophyceae sp. YPF-701]|nr:unnamed protein product [Pedinophyceae sp. YPF-701]